MERLKIQAFITLKLLRDSLMNEANADVAKELQLQVGNVSSAVVQDLQEYLLCPLTSHLQNYQISKKIKQHLVDCMRAIISRTRIRKIVTFNELFAILLYQIYDKNQQTMVISSYEEFKESVTLCMKDLLLRCTTDVIESLYVRENAPKLGKGIYLCVTIAKTEKLRALRLAAIETVMTLSLVHDEFDTTDIVLKAQAADVVMLFLPGIASGLQEVALGGEIQGHEITMMAIRAWGRVLTLVMEDLSEPDTIPLLESLCKNNLTAHSDPLGTSLNPRGPDKMKKLMETATRSQEWFDAAASKLNVLMRALVVLVEHSHFRVRRELATSVGQLLLKCPRNMKPNLTELVEILITLSEDDVEDVNKTARKSLNQISTIFAQGNYSVRPLIELLEESFYKLLTRLPRVIRTSEDSAQLSSMNQLAGYLRLLGKQRLPQIMASTAHLQRLLLALVYTTELDCSNVSLLEDVAVKDLDYAVHRRASHPWKEFKFIRDTDAEQKLKNVCQLLGELGDSEILVDSIFEMISDSPQHRKELTLLLNWIMESPFRHASILPLYRSVVDCYIAPESWYLPLTVSEEVSMVDAQNNVVQCCLLLEGLEIIAKTLGREYQKFLMKTLYLVIERAGSGQSSISNAGLRALESFATVMHHDTIADLLTANVDYISFHITSKLRRVERNPGVLDGVAVVMKYSTMDVLPCLKEIVQDVLSQSNTHYQDKNAYSFLKVFHTFSICMKRMVKSERKEDAKEKEVEIDPAETVIKSILEYYEAKKISERIEDDDLGGTPEDIAAELEAKNVDFPHDIEGLEDETKKPPPLYIEMTRSVMKRCIHFVPSKDQARKLLAMETLQEGLSVLADWEDELLPVVHELWHPLVGRFRDSSPLVINRAWNLLCTLAHVSRDFISSRTLKEVLPALSEFLGKAAKESHRKDSRSGYTFTQIFKLQRELLSQLGLVIRNLHLRERDLWQLLGATEAYLSAQQNTTLQKCCVQLYKDMADYNGDIVWVKCLSIWSPCPELRHPDPCFPIISVKVANSNIQNEYQKNIETIITYIQDKTLSV